MGDVYVESAWRVSVLGIYRKRRAFSGLLRPPINAFLLNFGVLK